MKTAYKYPLQFEDRTVVQLPNGYEVLCVQTQLVQRAVRELLS